jgi:ribosomal protein S18 acetylase RimI-like enzyme
MLALRPMTEDEYARFRAVLDVEYPQDRARNMGTPLEEERAISQKQIEGLLPQGLRTPGHLFWTAMDEAGAPVGSLWVAVDEAKRQGFIYDIVVAPEHRGKGYGRQVLDLLDDEVRHLGLTRIVLNVFGDNAVAQNLYRTAGYQTVAITMRKDL